MTLLESLAVEWMAAGLVLLVLGALVRFRHWTFLLAGYDGQSPVPDRVVAEMAGNTVLRVGLAAVAFGVVVSFASPPAYVSTVFEVAIGLAAVRLLYNLHSYSPADA